MFSKQVLKGFLVSKVVSKRCFRQKEFIVIFIIIISKVE